MVRLDWASGLVSALSVNTEVKMPNVAHELTQQGGWCMTVHTDSNNCFDLIEMIVRHLWKLLLNPQNNDWLDKKEFKIVLIRNISFYKPINSFKRRKIYAYLTHTTLYDFVTILVVCC